MSFSDPRTWVTGELVTASLLNVQLRDQLDAIVEGTTGAYVNAVTGPHAIGGSTVDYVRLGLTGAFTSGGASTIAFGLYTSGVLTGHSGDSAAIAGIKANNSIVTAGNCTTIAQLWVSEPQITVGAGTVTNSATVYIESAASEATNDYALWVDAGATQLDGTLDVAGHTALDATLSIGYGSIDDYQQVFIGGTLASGGASSHAEAMVLQTAITGAAGDTGWLAGAKIGPSITTQASQTIDHVSSLIVNEPEITVGSGATVTTASTLWIPNVPTEGTNNYALFVDDGASRFDGNVGIGGASTGARLEVEDGGISHPGPLFISRQDTDDVWNMVLCNDAYSTTALYGCRMTVGTNGDFNVYAPDKTSDPGDIKLFTDETQRLVIDSAGDVYSTEYSDYYSSSTIVGWSSLTAGRRRIMYKTIGKLVFVFFHLEGTSNATTVSFTLPYTSTAVGFGNQFHQTLNFTYDNTLAIATPGQCGIDCNTNIATCDKTCTASGGWTASGSKIVSGQFIYEMA